MKQTKPEKNEAENSPGPSAGPGKPSRLDIILGLIGFFTILCIPYVWWGTIKTLAGR